MKRSRHFETVVAQDSGQRDKLAALLESFRHSAMALEASIEGEERRTGKHDLTRSRTIEINRKAAESAVALA
jgi:hypothetical protein